MYAICNLPRLPKFQPLSLPDLSPEEVKPKHRWRDFFHVIKLDRALKLPQVDHIYSTETSESFYGQHALHIYNYLGT